MRIDQITTPALLLDLDRLDANLAGMADRATRLGVRLRPHIKTHKSIDIGRRQIEAGARGITVATLPEARAFADAGFDDITWAFPLIFNRIDEVVQLARSVRLAVLVDCPEAIDLLERSSENMTAFLKVDCGYHRAGVDPTSEIAMGLARRLQDSATLTFGGLLTHAGHSYSCADPDSIMTVAHQERDVMVEFAERLRAAGVEVPVVSIGSTPTMSVVDSLRGIDEIRPGNYAFYDLSQVIYGSCSPAQCALTVLTSVVSHQQSRTSSVIDAGALALSKDPGPSDLTQPSFGRIFRDHAAGELDETARLISLSQEHGLVNRGFAPGTRLRVLPNHSCLAAAQFDEYTVVRGDEVVDRWPIVRLR